MDVLQNYTTYKRFFGLIKKAAGDRDVPLRKGAKALVRYVDLHPANIGQVVAVIIEHFRLCVMNELGGRAKAMVVTGSRLAAVKYKLAFDDYIKDNNYTGIRSLVAFSGTVEDPDNPGTSYTEVSMNKGISESELPEAFASDDYRVLLVAEKYQTGFDQPFLHTMYIVKKLGGVQAVQTLSRLNRVIPGKSRTFVLDFENEADDIYQAFKPYYEETPIGENAEPHRLSELQHYLLEWAIFTQDDVNKFANIWYRKKRSHSATDNSVMNSILDAVKQRFSAREEGEQEEFRGQLVAYRNLYAFLSQIIPYQDSELEKLYTFVRNLLSKLPPLGDGRPLVLDDEVALRFFRLQQITDGSIKLGDGDADPLKGPTDLGTAAAIGDDIALSSLIDRLNQRFGTDFTEADQLFFDQVRASAERNEDIADAVRANNKENFASYLDSILDGLFIDRMDGNEEIFSRVMGDPEFRGVVHKYLAEEIFNRVRKNQTTT